MSKESDAWLNSQTLIGFTDKRGHAWHYREELQGSESNHYPGAIPVADVIRRLFSWKAEETPLYISVGGISIAIPGRKAIIRSDNFHVMGIFKDGYVPHQYDAWLVENVSTILGDTLFVGSAGLLRAGAQAWVSIEVPETVETPEGVAFRPNLLACTSFDGSLATTYKRVVQIIVCDNTLAAGLGESGQTFKLKHTRNSGLKITDAREALAIVDTVADDFAAEVKRLCETEVTVAQFAQFLDAYVPVPVETEGKSSRGITVATNKREELTKLYKADARVAPWANTAFGVLQAVNTYRHHVGTVRNADRAERNMTNALDGTTEQEDSAAMIVLDRVLSLA